MTTTAEHAAGSTDLAIAHAHPGYAANLRAALDAWAYTGCHFTADDVRDDVAVHPAGGGNVLPALLGAAVRFGRIRRCGDTTSTRPTRHGARVGIYVGTVTA